MNIQANISKALYSGIKLEAAMDIAYEALKPNGFDSIIYDFSPVPLTHDGEFILPTVFSMRNVPDDMAPLWCRGGYYGRDPVMDAARRLSRPFNWAHEGPQSRVMQETLSDRHQPVVQYLREKGMSKGITVPIQSPGGSLATFTAISNGGSGDVGEESVNLSAVGFLGQLLHDAIMPSLPAQALQSPHVSLTPRELQCLRLCSSGLTAKEIAHELNRSVATVTLHLTSATKKLGARNRFHALALAGHYKLLRFDA